MTDDKKIADCFNEYFSSIGSKLLDNIQNNDIDPLTFVTPVSKTFHFENVTVQVVYDALNGINIQLLKDASDIIAEPLVNNFNLSLRTAVFPDDWKLAKVKPLVYKEIGQSQTSLQKLNWIPIEKVLMKRETITTFKALTGRLPDYLQYLFRKSENKNYFLRSNNKKLSLPKPKTNFLKQSFSYRAAQRWNELADDITRDIDKLSLTSFIRRL